MAFVAALSPDSLHFVAFDNANVDADIDFSIENLPVAAQSGYILIEGVSLVLATSGTVATRRVLVTHQHAGAEVRRTAAAVGQAASLTERYCFGPQPGLASVVDSVHQDPLPALICPSSVSFLRLQLVNVQAGDVINNVCVWGKVRYPHSMA